MSKMLINGSLVEGKGGKLEVFNPATGEIIETFKSASIEQAEEALQSAEKAFQTWSKTSLNERVEWMMKLKAAFIEEKDAIMRLLWQEAGKNQNEALGEIGLLGAYIDFYAEEAKRVYGIGVPDYTTSTDVSHVVVRRPAGVVVGHLAWNAPIGNLAGKLPAALASGCTCVLKPSSSTPLSSLKIGEICAKVGLPKGVVNIISGPSDVIGNYLNSSSIPRLITVVGSVTAGREVMKVGSSSIKKYSLELGGNAPAIIMPDCDMDAVIEYISKRKVVASGQLCANVNRIFVHEAVHDEFVSRLKTAVEKIPIGWGEDMPTQTYMGSLINTGARTRIMKLIEDSVKMGAKLVYGGRIPELPEKLKKGAFIMPTILDQVTDDMPVAVNEVFGPVYPILTFTDFDDAMKRGNNTDLGLATYLFTHDSRVIGKFINEAEGGNIQVNWTGMGTNLPHIGIKQSGVGCDRGLWSLEEYYDIRRVSIKW